MTRAIIGVVAAAAATLARTAVGAPGAEVSQWTVEEAIAQARAPLETTGYKDAGSETVRKARFACNGTSCRYAYERVFGAGCNLGEFAFDLKDVEMVQVSPVRPSSVVIRATGNAISRKSANVGFTRGLNPESGCETPRLVPEMVDFFVIDLRDAAMASSVEAALTQAVSRARQVPPKPVSPVGSPPGADPTPQTLAEAIAVVKQFLERDVGEFPHVTGKASRTRFACEGSSCRYSFAVDWRLGLTTYESTFDLKEVGTIVDQGSGNAIHVSLLASDYDMKFTKRNTTARFKDSFHQELGYGTPTTESEKAWSVTIEGLASDPARARSLTAALRRAVVLAKGPNAPPPVVK